MGWCEQGDRQGRVVFAFHGLPGSRLQVHPDEDIATRAGARVIHLDRPGFGLSDASAGRTLKDSAADVRALADHLRIDRFALVGVSGGGPFACACACELGSRVTRTTLISSVGPPGTMSRSPSWFVRAGFALAPRTPWLLSPLLAVLTRLAARAPKVYVSQLIERLPQSDREIVARPAIRAMLERDVAESFRGGHVGFLRDLVLEASPWEIGFEKVACPVSLWHGARDNVVPPEALDALAALLPRALVRRLPEAGHFFVFDVWEEILGWLLGPTASEGITDHQAPSGKLPGDAIADAQAGQGDAGDRPHRAHA
jgi:pimeloyl-ACP methyl ester carboxylesterase